MRLSERTEMDKTDMNDTTWQPKIIAFVCNWCTYTGADLAGTSRLRQQANARLIRVPCTGRIDPVFIIKAFQSGADGVLVSGCHPGDCHYNEGNFHARRRWIMFRHLLDVVGIDDTRLFFSWVSASEGKKWVDVIDHVIDTVRARGPFKQYHRVAGAFARTPDLPAHVNIAPAAVAASATNPTEAAHA